MGSTIPQLTMFPLYPGGPQVRYNNTINANSSFYLPATKFTPQYGVNAPQQNTTGNTNYSLDGRTVQRANNTSLFDQPIGFDAAVLGGIKKTPVPSVAPVIPNLYQKAAELLSVTDLKMSELLSQPSFKISNIGPGTGLGLNVKTDGSGGIDTVSLGQSSFALNPNLSALDPTFGGLKRAEITTGATFKTELDGGLAGIRPVNSGNKPILNNNLANNNAFVNPLLAPNANQGIQQSGLFAPLDLNDFDLDDLELNPILQRLNQLQPKEAGLPVSGFDSAIRVDEARQIAATQAKLDVAPSDRFRQNLAGLVNTANRQTTESYAATFKNMDGRIPMAPHLPGSSQNIGQSMAGMGQDGFNLNSGLADASDKKGSGGYIPFQMQSNAQGGFAGSNPFMAMGGFANQSNQQQRRRLPAFVA